MWRKSVIWLASTLAFGAPAHAAEADVRPPQKLVCFTSSETREEIKAHHLLEPFTVIKSAQAQLKAEPLSAKLCKLGDEFIYVIALLHRDGRYIHVAMNAATGKIADTRRPRDTGVRP